MVMRKTAVAIPEELLAQVDAAARARGESRSRYIKRLLRLSVQARRDAEVTRRLNELFAAHSLAACIKGALQLQGFAVGDPLPPQPPLSEAGRAAVAEALAAMRDLAA